jgi:signal transduction histidine kinase/DNA-binding response OmpR family regulator
VSKTLAGPTIADDEARTSEFAADMPRNAAPLDTEVLQKAILSSADFAIIATDAKGIVQVFNAGAERLLGYAASDVINKMAPSELRDPLEVIARTERLSAEFATTITPGFGALTFKASRGIVDQYDLEYIRKDGSRFPAHVSITALRDDKAEIIGYLNVCTDNSARVAMMAADREKTRLKDEFVATVSHELRTPLTSIAGALGLLMGNAAGDLPDPTRRLLAMAHKNSQRLVRLVNDILDIEKMESGQVVFKFERVEIRSLVEQAIEANRGFAEGYGVRIRLEDASASGDVRADPDRLAQVVTNLLSNAIKFSPADHEVVVAIEKKTDVIRLSVRDHGSGIPANFKPSVFEKFAQADATNTRQKGGTGLGLSIVKQIVERLGGEVGFVDAPGGGTIFHVELPCWDYWASLATDRDASPDALRVLLCEDDPDTAVTLRERLRQIGFATDFAYSAGDAFTCATATQYRAILVDIHLPDGDGISLILRLRELPQYRDTSIVVVSADTSRGRADSRSSKLNVLDWLNKPIDFDRLMRVLAKPLVYNANRRPRILHVDEDQVVARALSEIADVVTVNSIEEAQRVLKASDFDLAVLDVALAKAASPDLMPELRDSKGNAIPVVIFSAQGATSVLDEHEQATLAKLHSSIDGLVAAVRDRLASRPTSVSRGVV